MMEVLTDLCVQGCPIKEREQSTIENRDGERHTDGVKGLESPERVT